MTIVKFNSPYSATTLYEIGDFVTYAGNLYEAKLQNTTVAPTNTTYWQLVSVGFPWKGNWSSNVTYSIGDTISFANNSYISIANTNSNHLPNISPYHWKPFIDNSKVVITTQPGDLQYQGPVNPVRLPIGNSTDFLSVSTSGFPYWKSTNNLYIQSFSANSIAANVVVFDTTTSNSITNNTFRSNVVVFNTATSNSITSNTITSNVALINSGQFSSISVSSSTRVDNLNSDLLDGNHGSFYTNYSNTKLSLSGGNISGNVSVSENFTTNTLSSNTLSSNTLTSNTISVTNLTVLNPIVGTLLSGSAPVYTEGSNTIGSIVTHNSWNNSGAYNNWSTSGPWTTFNNYAAYSDNSLVQWINMALNDGYGANGTTQLSTFGDSAGNLSKVIQWSNGNRTGHARAMYYWSNSTTYCGLSMRMLPIRNKTSSPISITLNAYCSNYWSAGYEGICLWYLYPNSGKYSQVTTVTSSLISNSGYASNGPSNNLTGTISVPANTTIIVCLTSTDFYYTTNQFNDTNYFYNLSTTFSDPGIICDLRMLSSLQTSKFNIPYNTPTANGTGALAPLWNMTAANFGDR